MKKVKTVMKVVCSWCGEDMGTKDGRGADGVTHGICKKCLKIQLAALPSRPARWNLIGRYRARRRARQRAAELVTQEEDRDAIRHLCENSSRLHAQVLLMGQRNVHYMAAEDLIELEARVADQPEFTCKWN